MITKSIVAMIYCWSLTIQSSHSISECNEVFRTSSGGIVTSFKSDSRYALECVFRINSTSGHVEMQIDDVQHSKPVQCYNEDECCKLFQLKITSFHEQRIFCHHNYTIATNLSGHWFQINFKTSKSVPHTVKLTYSVSKICKFNEYECQDRSGCYNKSMICNGRSECKDASDETDCSRRVCTNYFAEEVFFRCPINDKCISVRNVNDGVRDCEDGSDEPNISEEESYSYMTVLMMLFSVAFLLVIIRWCVYRRNLRIELENLPNFPLPPFLGPCDRNSGEISEADIQTGGEIFESYAQARRMSDNLRRNKIKFVKPPEKIPRISLELLDGDDNILALASLSLDFNSCVGLNKEDSKRIEQVRSSLDKSEPTCTELEELPNDNLERGSGKSLEGIVQISDFDCLLNENSNLSDSKKSKNSKKFKRTNVIEPLNQKNDSEGKESFKIINEKVQSSNINSNSINSKKSESEKISAPKISNLNLETAINTPKEIPEITQTAFNSTSAKSQHFGKPQKKKITNVINPLMDETANSGFVVTDKVTMRVFRAKGARSRGRCKSSDANTRRQIFFDVAKIDSTSLPSSPLPREDVSTLAYLNLETTLLGSR